MTSENFDPEECLSRLNALLEETTSGVSSQCTTNEAVIVNRTQTEIINSIKGSFGDFWNDNLSTKLILKETGAKCQHNGTNRRPKIKMKNIVYDAYTEREQLLKDDIKETREHVNLLESTLLDYKKCLAATLSQLPQ
ncbi:unnamed protein product [Phyllotreta striolata]|uniref:Uncharacterized protein n=1 Tax=Phyllotreta striolata TaxID=444603 RepID=A0A9N9TK53_PHYSR|nr:unnamed protein product [Phyllotreta striolata]